MPPERTPNGAMEETGEFPRFGRHPDLTIRGYEKCQKQAQDQLVVTVRNSR